MRNVKRLAMIALALLLTFGFASSSWASDGKGSEHTDSKQTVSFSKGITTIVTTKEEVTHDKIVKVDKSTDYSTEKKSKAFTSKKVDVKVSKEKHPKHKWYREVKTATTYKIVKTLKWDEVTKIDTIKTTITPVIIKKTTVTTLKHRGAPGSNGKVISEDTETFVDKKHGKPEVKVEKEKTVYKENETSSVDKKVIDVKKTYGKWVKK